MWVWAVGPDVHKHFQKTNAYPVIFDFTNVADLNKNLQAEGCVGKVDRLVVVSHGDAGGVLRLKPPLQVDASAVRGDFIHLRNFLAGGAKVIFVGCVAGYGGAGDNLFRSISAILAGCDIVSYTLQNTVYDWATGNWKVSRVGVGGPSEITRDDEWSEAAKWARNGAIVRPADQEVLTFQTKDPTGKLRCGSQHCIGHGKGLDRCNPYRRVVWPAWADVGASALEQKMKRPIVPQHPHHHGFRK